jgi:hypothetical protein
MQLSRTTIRLQTDLKKAAQHYAIQHERSFQDVINEALERFLQFTEVERDVPPIVFKSKSLGAPTDNLTREDIYAD